MELLTQSKSCYNDLFYNGWEVVENTSFFLYMIIGGRGIGKTYSILKGLLENDCHFMYVRRTETEIKNCCKEVNNPFITLNNDLDRNVKIMKNEDSYVIMEEENFIGLAGSLSTFGKFRGSDFSKINYIVFDEFISTQPRNTIKDEDELFYNMIETVMRNREFIGGKPIKVIMMSNSNRIDNDIINNLKLGEVIHQLKKNNETIYTDTERSIYLELPKDIPISKKKKEGSLYKLTKGTKFYDMSINNEFVNDSFDDVKKIKANDLIPYLSFEDIYFYQLKSSDKLYATYRKCECPHFSQETIEILKREYGYVFFYYIENKEMVYYNYDVKIAVKRIFK